MPSRRILRINELIRQKLGHCLIRDFRGQDYGLVTLTTVEVSPDLRTAYCYFSAVGAVTSFDEILAALGQYRVGWQKEIAQALKTKHTPRFEFRADRGLAQGNRVIDVLQSLEIPPASPDDLPED